LYWKFPALFAILSLILMIPLIIKWKLPRVPSISGAAIAALMAAIPFIWIYPLCNTRFELTAGIISQLALALCISISLMLMRFWRDPERDSPRGDDIILSPADGKVLYIRDIDEGSVPLVTKNGKDYSLNELTGTSLLSNAAYLIGVEMSFLDVHVNRCPINGRVRMLTHIKGKFMSLGKPESPFVNERFTTIIDNQSLSIVVVQVASRLVRRIESYLNEGEIVDIGQRLGVIKLGSLVAVVLPRREDIWINVQNGDRVTAGLTVLAHYSPSVERIKNSR